MFIYGRQQNTVNCIHKLYLYNKTKQEKKTEINQEKKN